MHCSITELPLLYDVSRRCAAAMLHFARLREQELHIKAPKRCTRFSYLLAAIDTTTQQPNDSIGNDISSFLLFPLFLLTPLTCCLPWSSALAF